MADLKDRMKDQIDAGAQRAKEVADQGARTFQHAKEQVGGLASSAVDKVREVAQTVAGAAGDAKEKVKEWSATAGQKANQATEAVREAAVEAYDRTTDFARQAGDELTTVVRRYPISALLISVGVGFMIGRMMNNRAT
jgi:ElaB/YqjD/DUF883 family membrane-anchored ribosome-binding protein